MSAQDFDISQLGIAPKRRFLSLDEADGCRAIRPGKVAARSRLTDGAAGWQ